MSMTFVMASRANEDGDAKIQRATKAIRAARGGKDEIVVVRDAPSMAAAYNKGMAEAKNERICFTHNDVEIRAGEYWEDEVLDALFEKFPIGFLGVAGSKDVFPDGRWYVDGNRMSGGCFHGQYIPADHPAPQGARRLEDGRHYAEAFTAYGDYGRVVALDGVLLISTKTVLGELGGFSEADYPGSWHYYDLDATLRAHLAGKHNLTIPLFLCHMSPGSYNDQWALTRDKFIEKWKDKLPITLEFHDDYTVEALRNVQFRQARPAGA